MSSRERRQGRTRLTFSRGETLSLGLAVLALIAAVVVILLGLAFIAFVAYAIVTFP